MGGLAARKGRRPIAGRQRRRSRIAIRVRLELVSVDGRGQQNLAFYADGQIARLLDSGGAICRYWGVIRRLSARGKRWSVFRDRER